MVDQDGDALSHTPLQKHPHTYWGLIFKEAVDVGSMLNVNF